MELANKLEQFAETLDPAEKACLKILLANAVADKLNENLMSDEGVEANAYKTSVAAINRLQFHKNLIPYNGVVYRGRPAFVDQDKLEILQNEAASLRHKALRFHDHLVVTDAPFALQFSMLPELTNLLSEKIGPVMATGKANYIYYDQLGLGIEPHIDNEDFSLNAIMMLQHEHEDLQSALVLYPLNRPAEKIFLNPGELIIFFADSIIHARERMSMHEKVTIVAFGFKPL